MLNRLNTDRACTYILIGGSSWISQSVANTEYEWDWAMGIGGGGIG